MKPTLISAFSFDPTSPFQRLIRCLGGDCATIDEYRFGYAGNSSHVHMHSGQEAFLICRIDLNVSLGFS